MKIILALTLCSAIYSQKVLALDTSPTTLALTMDGMKADLKTIASQVNNPAKNAESARLATDFVMLVQEAESFVPDSVSSLPASQQPARLALYKEMLDAVAKDGLDLAAAFRANQNKAAVDLIRKLAQMKTDGHKEFN